MKRLLTTCTLLAALSPAGATTLFEDDFSGYAGTGVAPGGGGGTLDSSHWAVTGLSEGDSAFGETRDGGDFGRGLAAGAATTGGIYAFTPEPGRSGPAFGLQATGADLSPGLVLLGIVNPLDSVVRTLEIGFTLWHRNDAGRATRVALLYAGPGLLRMEADPLDEWLTPGAGEADAPWRAVHHASSLAVNLAPGAGALLAWSFDDAGGTGARDELALDDVWVRSAAPAVLPAPAPFPLVLAALCALAAASARLGLRPAAPSGSATITSRRAR